MSVLASIGCLRRKRIGASKAVHEVHKRGFVTAGAGSDITLPLGSKPTSVLLVEGVTREDGNVVLIILLDVTGEGSEVQKSGGGLGTFKSVLDVFLLIRHGLDLESDGILLPVEFMESSSGMGSGVDVGGEAPVVLLVCLVDKGVDVGRFGVEKFNKPWGKGR